MSDPRTFASLSSSLLARKGHARPAMRPHSFDLPSAYDDLGWNDMGQYDRSQHDRAPHYPPLAEADENAVQPVPPAVLLQQAGIAEEMGAVPEEKLASPPAAEPAVDPVIGDPIIGDPVIDDPAEEAALPLMATKRPSIARRKKAGVALSSGAKPVASPAAVVLPRNRTGGKAKAAFTLRLDPERHLRLRLASAIGGRSAQVIVTEALDALLGTMPEIEALAAQSAADGER